MYNIFVARKYADVAQSVERILGKDEVASSILAISSNKNPLSRKGLRGFWLPADRCLLPLHIMELVLC